MPADSNLLPLFICIGRCTEIGWSRCLQGPHRKLTHLAVPGEGEGALAQAGNLLAQPIRPLHLRPQVRLHSTPFPSAFCCFLNTGWTDVTLKDRVTVHDVCCNPRPGESTLVAGYEK